MASTRRILTLAAGAATVAALALPAAAAATVRYVDDSGTNAGGCTNAASPCQTIPFAVGVSSAGDVIQVGGGTYAGGITLPDGVSLEKADFKPPGTTGAATIGTTADSAPGVTVGAGLTARTVSGFAIRGGHVLATPESLLVANGTDNVTITGNTFDDTGAGLSYQLRAVGGSPVITNNSFFGAADAVTRWAAGYSTGTSGAPVISHNTISNFFEGIQVTSASPSTVTIQGNSIIGIHQVGAGVGIGIDVNTGSGTITDNFVAATPAQTISEGMMINTTTSPVTLDLSRNQVYGFPNAGAQLSGGAADVLNDDLFANNTYALSLYSTGPITATNLTAASSGTFYEIYLADNTVHLTLNSSFVGNSGAGVSLNGGTCTSSYSMSTHSPAQCGMTQIADPMFVNAGSNNFRTLAGSPLIDAGDPAAPAFATDLPGNPRAVAILGCPARRDIGAYEFTANALDCTPPASAPSSSSPTTIATPRKKCRKRKRHRSHTATVAKKRCKKRR